jgi:hypothetical protein
MKNVKAIIRPDALVGSDRSVMSLCKLLSEILSVPAQNPTLAAVYRRTWRFCVMDCGVEKSDDVISPNSAVFTSRKYWRCYYDA